MNSTLKYYEKNSEQFIQDTLHKEMQIQYDIFEKYLYKSAHILDAGCGSGRDSLYFKSRGYGLTAFDASQKMCDFASDLIDEKVIKLRLEEMKFENSFDAIWASASLLHVSKEDMPSVLSRLALALKKKVSSTLHLNMRTESL
jgi:SAM-dependent methyltransferase